MQHINLLAIFTSSIIVFFLGGIWYSEKLFGKIWQREANITKENKQCSHSPIAFILSFIYTLIAAVAFAIFLPDNYQFMNAIEFGLAIGICFVATSLGTNYLFTNRSFILFLIDGGYIVTQFLIFGLIIGLWK